MCCVVAALDFLDAAFEVGFADGHFVVGDHYAVDADGLGVVAVGCYCGADLVGAVAALQQALALLALPVPLAQTAYDKCGSTCQKA